MAAVTVVVLLSMSYLASAAMEGVSDSKDWWAYQWYTGEPFRFTCQTSGLNITSDNYVVWDTPTTKYVPSAYDGEDYAVKTVDGIENVELLVKKVEAKYHGVYTCNVYERTTRRYYGKIIYGLNIRDVKYHEMIDKYRNNIIVAVIATAVFIVPFATICFVWQFRYEERERRKLGKGGKKSYIEDNEMKVPPTNSVAATVMSPEGKGAYENLDVDLSTQL